MKSFLFFLERVNWFANISNILLKLGSGICLYDDKKHKNRSEKKFTLVDTTLNAYIELIELWIDTNNL